VNPPKGVYPFQSDRNLAADKVVGPEMTAFGQNKTAWNGAFANAMGRLQMLGVPKGGVLLADCTPLLP